MPSSVAAVRAYPPTCAWLGLLLFVAAQAVNSWQEVRGPGSVGVALSESGFAVEAVPPGLPLDVAGVRVGDVIDASSLFSVTPQLFLNPMRWYTPDRQAAILAVWLAISGVLVAGGVGALWLARRRLSHGPDRRRVTLLLSGLGCAAFVGVHNVLARNWTWFSEESPPAWLDDTFVAAEGVVFALVVAGLVYAVARQGEDIDACPPLTTSQSR